MGRIMLLLALVMLTARTHRMERMTPEQRRAEMRRVVAERVRRQREDRISELIKAAPPLRPDQVERLKALLSIPADGDGADGAA